MSHAALKQLGEHLGEGVLATHQHRGDETAVIAAPLLGSTCLWLRDTPQLSFDMLCDLTAVDWLEQGRQPRFEVVYHLNSLRKRHRLRIKVGLDDPQKGVDSVSHVWSNANWLEREVWDMYGIAFSGHPNLRRILLYDQFEGHPLRKDYPKQQRQPLVRRPAEEIEQVLASRSEGKRDLL